MGITIREKVKGSGEWWIFIHHNNKRTSKRVGAKKAALEVKAEAEKLLAQRDWNIEQIKPKHIPTLKEYVEGWQRVDGSYQISWLERRKNELKHGTIDTYRATLSQQLLPRFGDRLLSEIDTPAVYDMVTELQHKFSLSLAKNAKAVLSAIFETAIVIDKMSLVNPTRFRTRSVKQEVGEKEEVMPFTREERANIEATYQKHFPHYYPVVFAGFRLGTRIGELLALQWKDIDFGDEVVRIRRAFSHGRLTTPKSSHSRRSVRISPQLIGLFRQMRDNRERIVSIDKPVIDEEWVFTNTHGELLTYSNFIHKIWPLALRKAEIVHRGTHAMRHTYATLRLSSGDPIAEVSKELGHSKPETTFRVYFEWMPKESKTDLSELDKTHLSAPHTHPIAITND